MNPKLERILPRVQKPARYTGGEYNAIIKELEEVSLRVAFCFPDTYEIGMSNLGMRILYDIMNGMEGVWCERVFAPWVDMEAEMRREDIPLYALESGDPITHFDFVAFSLGYEMAYTNVLNMLDLGKIPVLAAERGEGDPIVVAGGTCAFNGEPLADFVDIFSLGEGEDVTVEMLALYQQGQTLGWSRQEYLRRAAQIPGLYVPSLYRVTYLPDGRVDAITPEEGVPAMVTKRIVQDLDKARFPVKTIIPSTEIVHDRVMLEVFRGCIRGCRFCQAGYTYRPVRTKSVKALVEQGIASAQDSGYEEMTLCSLSTSDYRPLNDLCDGLLEFCEPRKISLNLPSLRADNFSMELMERIQRTRKSGLTFAPEAGTQRLRDAINKDVTEEDVLNTARKAFSGGYSTVKLYFMLGLPTETDEDVLGIADLAFKVYQTWREVTPNRSRGVKITVSTSFFVPKPHTPFQWEAQISMEEYQRRVKLLREHMRNRSIVYNWHDADMSYMEAVLARGDRRLGQVIYRAWQKGAHFDSWDECYHFDLWMETFRECGIDPEFYTSRPRTWEEVLPWDMIDDGVKKRFLWKEREACYRAEVSPNCRKKCTGCGANCLLEGGRKCDE